MLPFIRKSKNKLSFSKKIVVYFKLIITEKYQLEVLFEVANNLWFYKNKIFLETDAKFDFFKI